jgi:ribosomal protein S18 acetylase RimI-like enzyme
LDPTEAGNAANELGWWSSWAERQTDRHGTEYLFSKDFDEPLFNRAILMGPPRDPAAAVESILEEFGKRGRKASLFLRGSEEYGAVRMAAAERGFARAEGFLVMEQAGEWSDAQSSVIVEEASSDEAEAWSRAYLHAFYGEESLLGPVAAAARNALRDPKNSLLLAMAGGRVLGTTAVRVESGYAGIYCVGTVPGSRRMGVAGSLLARASEEAARSRAKPILQVMEGDGYEPYYLRRGFRRAFAEDILTRP